MPSALSRISASLAGPKRIQRRRTKGWRMPESAIYVGRPTRWGNPFVIGRWIRPVGQLPFQIQTAKQAVILYEMQFYPCPAVKRAVTSIQAELRGHDLACFCPLDQPCHADVLLKLANASLAGWG